jgi:hypothetical protein
VLLIKPETVIPSGTLAIDCVLPVQAARKP